MIGRSGDRALPLLAAACAASLALAVVLARRYSFDTVSLLEYLAGASVLLIALMCVLVVRRTVAGNRQRISRAVAVGLALGSLWTVEILVNNLLAPPLPARDIIDDAFWALVAIGVLGCAVVAGRNGARLVDGVHAGLWAGIGSGAVACLTALSMVVLGLRFITADPLSIKEWAGVAGQTPAPDISAYFALQTFAGALGHLGVLGAGMGVLLGLVGGLVGARAARGLPNKRIERTPRALS
jgi:hypothetical protein